MNIQSGRDLQNFTPHYCRLHSLDLTSVFVSPLRLKVISHIGTH